MEPPRICHVVIVTMILKSWFILRVIYHVVHIWSRQRFEEKVISNESIFTRKREIPTIPSSASRDWALLVTPRHKGFSVSSQRDDHV